MTAITLYRGARDPAPAQVIDLPWRVDDPDVPDIVGSIMFLGIARAPTKTQLPAIAPHRLREGETRANASIVAITALVIDVDACDLDTLDKAIRARAFDALVYASPSDPNADGSRRVRVVAPITREIAPADCRATRIAFAEALGLRPGCGVEGALDASRLFFVGAIDGAPMLEIRVYAGAPVNVDTLDAPALDWRAPDAKDAPAGASDSLPTEIPAPTDAARQIAEIIASRWLDGDRVETHAWLHLAGWLMGVGWTKGQLAALLETLDADEGDLAKIAEHRHILSNARPIEGPGGARAWLGEDFDRVDAIVNAPLDAIADAIRAANQTHGADMPSTLILQSRSDPRHVLLWENADVGYQPIANEVMRHRARELNLPMDLTEPSGNGRKPSTPRALIERHGETYLHTARDFSARATIYDRETSTVTIGYPVPAIAAAYDADVDAWLRALGGEQYSRLAVWLASCSQEHVSRLAAVLVLLGSPDVGKSMLACAIASLWGQDTAPRADLLVSRFNGDLERCPIVFDDEARLSGSGRLSTKDLREIAQSTERAIERKGREQTLLRGGFRLMIAANAYGDVRMTDLTGPDVVQAVADRVLVVEADASARAALDPLREDDYRVDLPRVTRHLAWLATAIDLPRERFLGAGGSASAALLSEHVAKHAIVFATLQLWLDVSGAPAVVPSWYAFGGELCADAGALSGALAMDRVDLACVREAVAPFAIKTIRPRIGAVRPRLTVLDVGRVRDACAWDAETRETWLDRAAASTITR